MVRQAFSAAGGLSGAVQMGKRQVQCLCVAGAFASCKDVFCEGSLPEPFRCDDPRPGVIESPEICLWSP